MPSQSKRVQNLAQAVIAECPTEEEDMSEAMRTARLGDTFTTKDL